MKTLRTPTETAELCVQAACMQLLFTAPIAQSEKKIKIRKIILKGKECYQIERFNDNKAFHQNIDSAGLARALAEFFSCYTYAECTGTREKLWFVRKNSGKIALVKQETVSSELNTSHDYVKNVRLNVGSDTLFLQIQGITGTAGKVLKEKYHKFRQINKFLEFIDSIIPVIEQHTKQSTEPFSIIDFGCGKAYLTFALYYYLHEQKKLPVSVHGLDLKDEVITQCSDLAQHCGYEHLSFSAGDIAQYQLPIHTGMVLCLHACNTATDYALANAVHRKVPIIFAVPCCQHELHSQLKKQKKYFKQQSSVFLPFLEHGIITERFSSLLTDTLRALILESCGYDVQIIEFIETEHTPKNLLIRAVKRTCANSEDSRDVGTAGGAGCEQNQGEPSKVGCFRDIPDQHRIAAYKKFRKLADACSVQPLLESLLHDELPL
ncbi:MAG: class I SAM-dependent methyltransferase [Treponema sp.]